MYRSMIQVYVKGSVEAAKFYQKAFDTKMECEYFDEDGKYYMHAELKIYGQHFALSEQLGPATTGNTMQLCLHFGPGGADKVYKIYEVLKEGAEPHNPVGDSGYSEHMFALVDKFGVSWCVYE